MYGTLENGIMKPAPRAVRVGGSVVCNPTDAQYESAGYKRVVDEPPSEPPAAEGSHYERREWVESGCEICRQYVLVQDPPPPPRVWTPLAIKRACGERWPAVRDALQTAGIYEDFIMAQELREDDAAFAQGYNWAVSEFGAEVVDAILAAAEGAQ